METTVALDAFAALSQPTRLEAFRRLVRAGPEGLPAGGVAQALGVPANTMSTHLAILERAGLVASRREGRLVYYVAALGQVRDLVEFLLTDCCAGNAEMCADVAAIAARTRACC